MTGVDSNPAKKLLCRRNFQQFGPNNKKISKNLAEICKTSQFIVHFKTFTYKQYMLIKILNPNFDEVLIYVARNFKYIQNWLL